MQLLREIPAAILTGQEADLSTSELNQVWIQLDHHLKRQESPINITEVIKQDSYIFLWLADSKPQGRLLAQLPTLHWEVGVTIIKERAKPRVRRYRVRTARMDLKRWLRKSAEQCSGETLASKKSGLRVLSVIPKKTGKGSTAFLGLSSEWSEAYPDGCLLWSVSGKVRRETGFR